MAISDYNNAPARKVLQQRLKVLRWQSWQRNRTAGVEQARRTAPDPVNLPVRFDKLKERNAQRFKLLDL